MTPEGRAILRVVAFIVLVAALAVALNWGSGDTKIGDGGSYCSQPGVTEYRTDHTEWKCGGPSGNTAATPYWVRVG